MSGRVPQGTMSKTRAQADHSACGVGFVASARGEASYRPLDLALDALARMEHRGGVGADGVSSDGAGVLTAIPWRLVAPWFAEHGTGQEASLSASSSIPTPSRVRCDGVGRPGAAALGMVFLPRHPGKQRLARDLVAKALSDEGLTVIGWREVPVDPSVLGPTAGAHRPQVEQVLASSPLADDDLERALLLARRRIGAALQAQKVIRRLDDLYVCSLSGRTVVYKGMLGAEALPAFFPDLRDPAFVTPFAVFHRRFSTNTLPKWSLAQPMRLVAHNGEIDTLSGNLNWMAAREPDLAHEVWGARIRDLLPSLHADSSDSAALDKFIELLVRSGRSPLEAFTMTMPPAYETACGTAAPSPGAGAPSPAGAARHERRRDRAVHGAVTDPVTDFLEYAAGVLEAWDGPALVAFADGRFVGAAVDRNGLRPARTAVSATGMVAVASEAGAVDFGDDPVVARGRLGPGQMLAVDLTRGLVLADPEVKRLVASRHPYGDWLRQERVVLRPTGAAAGPAGGESTRHAAGAPPAPDPATLLRLQTAAGYTAEDVDLVIRPMARTGREPRFSMGDDAPLPVLSGQPHTLYDYFTQRFAQVTNPPIDPLRESLVMSLAVRLGGRGNLLEATPGHARQVRLDSPLLDDDQLAAVRSSGLRTATVATRFPVADGPWGLRHAVEEIAWRAAAEVRDGAEVVVLSDRADPVEAGRAAVPPLLAVGAVHHHLIRIGLRSRASLIAETAQCWASHHFACLIGYGASAVVPYVTLATVRALAGHAGPDTSANGGASGHSESEAAAAAARALTTYRASVDFGLRKVLSKMGISLLASYHGAQLFEAVGIGPDLLELGFRGTPSRIGGLSVEELAEETIRVHRRAFPELTEEKLRNYGFVRFRRGGEYHLNNPEAARMLRRACVEGSYELFEQYIARMRARPPTLLRDLLDLRSDRRPIEVADTEPAAAIVGRFATGGMSLGALSREAHETLAVAMNRVGGKANSGEGGEDPRRFRPLDDVDADGRSARLRHVRGLHPGDSARTAIKQVASGRFGVTPAYLVNADEMEIKVAQGAKPGEGGELPGPKVTAYVASLRRARPGRALISPPPHHDIYSIEDLAQLIHDLRAVNPTATVTVKLVAGWGIGTIAAGVAKAGADVIHVSGSSGGTAAASLNSIKHAGIPWELGLLETHRALRRAGLRGRVRLRTDGGLRTGRDVLFATLLGADEVAFGTAALIAEGCVMARACHLDRCPAGIATQRDELRERFAGEPQHVVNYFSLVARRVRVLLAELGYGSLTELVGRTDLLRPVVEVELAKTSGLDWDWLRDMDAVAPATIPGPAAGAPAGRTPDARGRLDSRLIADPEVARAIREHGTVTRHARIGNADRAVGAAISGEIARLHGDDGFRGRVRLELSGIAGQSFGAFLVGGVTLALNGEANDYVGKGMAGGEIVLWLSPPGTGLRRGADGAGDGPQESPPHSADVIAGNTCLYGATGGRLFAAGAAGERLAVRNSAAVAVVEGAGDHCCEYMTGGTVVVLGPVGRNACAGMTGGTAYFLEPPPLASWLNSGSVVAGPLVGAEPPRRSLPAAWPAAGDDSTRGDLDELRGLLAVHRERTGSAVAAALLADWPAAASRFVRVTAAD